MSSIVEHEPSGPEHAGSPSVQLDPATSRRATPVIKERQRAARACDGCRRTKEKCIGVPCRRCVRLQHQCKFTNVGTKRAPTSKTRNASHSVDDGTMNTFRDRAIYMERILKHYVPDLDFGTESLRQKAQGLVPEDEDAVQDVTGSPASDSGADVTIQDESCTIITVNDNIAHYSGEFSYWNFSMRLNKQVQNLMDTEDQRHIPHYWRVEQLHSSSTTVSEARSNFPPLQIAEFLVHVFLKHATSNYFYFESHWLLEKLSFIYDKSSDLTTKDAGILAIMLAVFAIGTQYAHLESPKRVGSRNDPQDHRQDELGAVFYQQAARLLPEVIHLGSLESVQACLLLGFYALPIDASGLGYIYLNLAMKLAMQNGMHRRTPDHIFGPEMADKRNKVWWTVYCLEKKISIYHGRPISIRPSDIDADLPRDEPDLQAAESSSSVSNLLVLITLTDYLGKFADEIFLLRTSPKSQTPGVLTRLISRKDELKKRWSALSLKNQSLSRPNIHLQLEYCLLRMFVGRPFLLGRDVPGLSPGSSSEDTMVRHKSPTHADHQRTQQSPRKSHASALVDDCIQAATEAIDLCQLLRDNGTGLASVSYIEYSSCRASLLVLIAFCIRTQTIQCYDHQQRGLEIIREMSGTGESARHEVLLIEALERAVKRLHLLDLRMQSSKSSEMYPKIGYDDFKQWGAVWKATGSMVGSGSFHAQAASVTTQSHQPHEADGQANEPRQVAYNVASPATNTRCGPAALESDEPGFLARDGPPAVPDSTFLGWDNMFPGPNDFYDNSERQLLENFLAIPEGEFSFPPGLESRQQTATFSTMNSGHNQVFHQTPL